jgi:hypothetical protein
MGTPYLANRRVDPIPFLGKQVELDLRFRFRAGRIDQFQISGDLLAMCVGHLLERVAHQVNHTELHPCMRIDGLNRFR